MTFLDGVRWKFLDSFIKLLMSSSIIRSGIKNGSPVEGPGGEEQFNKLRELLYGFKPETNGWAVISFSNKEIFQFPLSSMDALEYVLWSLARSHQEVPVLHAIVGSEKYAKMVYGSVKRDLSNWRAEDSMESPVFDTELQMNSNPH